MMRIYIAGPMTGLPDYNREAFDQAAERLRVDGFEAVSPAHNGLPDEAPWEDHLRLAIRKLMDCDGIALLPGWEKSKGATLERHIARELGFPEVIL